MYPLPTPPPTLRLHICSDHKNVGTDKHAISVICDKNFGLELTGVSESLRGQKLGRTQLESSFCFCIKFHKARLHRNTRSF